MRIEDRLLVIVLKTVMIEFLVLRDLAKGALGEVR